MPSERSTPTRRRAYGASSGPQSPVPQPASRTSSRFAALDARVLNHGRNQRRRAVRQPLELRLEAGGEAVERPLDERVRGARAGTSRPVHAASMCRAIGSSGSSCSHSSKIATASPISPSVQCASASSLRASWCFGLSVMTLLKQAAASSVRFSAVEQDAQVGVGVDVLRVERESRRGRRLPPRRAWPVRPQQHAEIAVRVGVAGSMRNRALTGDDRPPRACPVDL